MNLVKFGAVLSIEVQNGPNNINPTIFVWGSFEAGFFCWVPNGVLILNIWFILWGPVENPRGGRQMD